MTEAPARAAVVRRLLPAAPDIVYDEWLDPGALADWMCPRPARCLNIESEPRLGGRLRIDIEDGGTEFWVSGEYLVLDRPGRLSFSWSCSTWPDPGLKSVVNVLLEPRENEQTLMTIEHTLLPPGLVDQHERGWTAIAQQLADELAASGASPLPRSVARQEFRATSHTASAAGPSAFRAEQDAAGDQDVADPYAR
jgi:uncharacterized protein YndB with AHSA1/START domain